MSTLTDRWVEMAREEAEADPRDIVVCAEATDMRHGLPRRVVVARG